MKVRRVVSAVDVKMVVPSGDLRWEVNKDMDGEAGHVPLSAFEVV